MMPSKPLLGLCMIVKDEAAGIVETLASIAPLIDTWTILDTGSTDNTRDLVRSGLSGVAGDLYEEPFVDFATTRNRVLELHGDKSEYVIMLSGDDIVVVDPGCVESKSVRHMLASYPNETVWNVRRVLGSSHYVQPAVFRPSAGWRYKGRTHECLVHGIDSASGYDGARLFLPITIRRDRDGTPEQKQARWEADVELLKADIREDPTNGRLHFHLAQTYECLGQYDLALRGYQARISQLGVFADETYEAMFRRARVLRRLESPWPVVQQAYLDAYAFDPSRAEPLFEIATFWFEHDKDGRRVTGYGGSEGEGNHALCYLFAAQASTISLPSRGLYVDVDLYRWKIHDLLARCASHLAKRTEVPMASSRLTYVMEMAARRAYQANPDLEHLRELDRFANRAAGSIRWDQGDSYE